MTIRTWLLLLPRVRHSSSAPEVRLLYDVLAFIASRTGELRKLRWDEIDWEMSYILVPAHRVKQRHEFAIPMSSPVVSRLKYAKRTFRESEFVFPGKDPTKPLSPGVLPHTLKKLNVGAVPHGLRASFRTWAAEQGVRDPVAEACLAHGPKTMVGKAYIRTTFFDERREVMERWAQYLLATDPTSGDRAVDDFDTIVETVSD